jgi:eukaryotic-like serine/threonine-protein kinase
MKDPERTLVNPNGRAFDATAAASTTSASGLARSLAGARSTVLPRIVKADGSPRVVVEGKPRYEEVRPLGSGGQAQVTLTRDHDIDRVVALKRLLPENNDDASVLRFAEEVRTVGRLEHPNIVPIHDVGVDEKGQYFFVMKYVEGETLESVIAKLRVGDAAYQARYTQEYRLQICNEILRGVQHAHEQGILHRDLKPANVMIGSLGEVVVMDWGLARKVGAPASAPADDAARANEPARMFETQIGALVGTPAYMSPEQAAGQPLDERSDVYSLAVMFYEFLSLCHPRSECRSVAEMIASVNAEPINKMRLVTEFAAAGAAAAMGHFVKHGLEHDPARRYQTVAAMRERLEAVRDRHAPIECYVTFTQRILGMLSHGADRHPWLLAAVMLLIVASAVTGVVMVARG